MSKDTIRWAKKFDKVAHLYDPKGGTLCRSSAACLGNNYATTDMDTCPKCAVIKNHTPK